MWRTRAVGSVVYTTASVTFDWAGAVMKKPLVKRRTRRKRKGGPTETGDRQTDQQTDRVTQ